MKLSLNIHKLDVVPGQASEHGAIESMMWSRAEAVNFKLASSFMMTKAMYYYSQDMVLSRMKCDIKFGGLFY